MVQWNALDALSHQLELCAVSADTRLVVLVDPTQDPDQVAHMHMAIERSGASAIEVHLSPGKHAANEPLAAAVAAADLIITTGGHRDTSIEAAHILHVHPLSPEQFPPSASLRRRVNTLTAHLDSATTLSISDANGTNLRVELGANTVTFDHGLVTRDNRRCCFPAGWVKIIPAASTVHGQLVLMPGDANLGAGRLINSPVVLHIVDDHVSAIEGDTPDADIVRALLEHPEEPSAYGIASIGVGLNPGPVESGVFDTRLLDPVVSQLLAGIVQISFGENLAADRPCRQTVTMALRARTVHLDELPVIVRGQLEGDIAPDVYEL